MIFLQEMATWFAVVLATGLAFWSVVLTKKQNSLAAAQLTLSERQEQAAAQQLVADSALKKLQTTLLESELSKGLVFWLDGEPGRQAIRLRNSGRTPVHGFTIISVTDPRGRSVLPQETSFEVIPHHGAALSCRVISTARAPLKLTYTLAGTEGSVDVTVYEGSG